MSPLYIVGLDLGPPGEFTAISVVERTTIEVGDVALNHYAVRHLERYTPGASFPDVVERIASLFDTAPVKDGHLLVDETGVGSAVARLIRKRGIPAKVRSVVVTNGFQDMRDTSTWRLPKTELVGTLQLLLQTRRLKVASDLPDAATLVKELADFRAKPPTKTGDDLADWRDRPHDDLVLAVAIATWFGERGYRVFNLVC